jgi:hypothetical protein
MASASRNFARGAFKSTPSASAFKTLTRNTAFTLPRQTLRQQFRRGYASEPSKSSSSSLYIGVGALALAGGAGYYLYAQGNGSLLSGSAGETKGIYTPKFDDYQKIYNEIAERLEEKDDYDDGSYGPVLVRLAWHASGTYDKETGTGGSNGATMRFNPEGGHGANAGLQTAREFLEPVKRECFVHCTFSIGPMCTDKFLQKSSHGSHTPTFGSSLVSVQSKRCRALPYHIDLGEWTRTLQLAHLMDACPMLPKGTSTCETSFTVWASTIRRLSH